MTTPATAPAGYLRYDGRVAVVTGAGGGLGRAYALLLGSRGAKVVVNDVGGSVAGAGSDTRAADKVVAEIREAGGEAVSDYNSVEDGDAIIRTSVQAFGKCDILICNAGILRDGTFGKMSDAAWESVYKVHLYGSFSCARAAWNHMRDNLYGRMVFVTSSSGLYGNVGQSNYAAAKMGILGLANTLAREGARKNIIVNTVAPIAASRMTENVMPPDLVEVLKPESVAPVVGYLAHESCTTTSGVYELGGGWVSRLRWQRSRGAFLPAGQASSLESVKAAWADANKFDNFAAYPDSTQSSFEPIMENLRKDTSALAALDDSTGASAARSLALSTNLTDGPASSSSPLLAILPGGNYGRSDALDVPATLGHQLKTLSMKYTDKDACLYALSVGASVDPLNQKDLAQSYEMAPGFHVIPTFAVTFPHALMAEITAIPSLRFNPMMLLHGEQELVLPTGALPLSASITTKGRISNVYDKGSGAVVVFEAASTDNRSGALLAINRSSIFIRGIGGFGGDRGPASESWSTGDRSPSKVVTFTTFPSQALLYRLNGDTNPLHVDPDMAALGGFSKPILHGLCTFGLAGRQLVTDVCEGDAGRVKSIKARFSKHVFPGETLITNFWVDGEPGSNGLIRVLFSITVKERNELALTHGVAMLSATLVAKL